METPLIISFFTKDTIYEKEIEDLISSCKTLGVDFHIEARKDLGRWDKNCCQKPLFILECLKKFQRPLLWVDADGIVLQKPSLLLKDIDLGIYFSNYEKRFARTATLYIAPTEGAFRFLNFWYESCQESLALKKPIPYGDESVFSILLRTYPLKIGNLPLSHVHIFDRDVLPMEEVHIVHFQASRTSRMDPRFWKTLTGTDLKKLRISNSKFD